MPYWVGIRGCVVAALTATAIVVPAVLHKVSAEETPAGPVPVTLIQFRSFMAPVKIPGVTKPCQQAVTLLVEVHIPEAKNVCTSMPRIRDAVLVELFRHPIVMKVDSGMDVQPVEARLRGPLNRVLGKGTVLRVYLIPGSEVVARSAIARLPFNRIGCQRNHRGRV